MNKTVMRLILGIMLICWMFIIFWFSNQPATESSEISGTISYRLVEDTDDIFNWGLTAEQIRKIAGNIEYPIRKAAHMTEYAIFSIFVMIALIVDGIKGVRIPVISAVIAIAFAATDEFHQTFVPGRYGCVLDVLIDAAGSIIGLIIVYIIYKNMCKHKGEKCNNIN